MNFQVKNPIIPGYSPDPSICRVGEDFYLVNSTFEFFPGVPIYHSKNLVNWELIGHCLTRESQLPLRGCRNSGGIYAPTIRYHEGIFYMITTNVTDGGNFIVHTDDITKEWSELHHIDQRGIDPSIFWDDNGKCYFCGTDGHGEEQGIVCFELNPLTGEILSDKKIISQGCGGKCPEGPHIYKKDGYYYLMLAEGGTEYGHHETMQRSESVWGPYVPCPHNPILYNGGRRGQDSPIQATGHADLVEDQNGNYWLVCLAIRPIGHAMLHNLGRETFLAPVKWEKGAWPVVGNDGMVEISYEAQLPNAAEKQNYSLVVPFNGDFSKHLMFTRNPNMEDYNIDNGRLALNGSGVSINEAGASPTILSIRQPDFETEFTACVSGRESKGKKYGISAYYNNDYHYDLYLNDEENGKFLYFYKHVHDFGAVIKKVRIEADNIKLIIRTDRESYKFFVKVKGQEIFMGSGHSAGLSTEGTMTMTFTGTLFAVYCEEGKAVFEDKLEIKA